MLQNRTTIRFAVAIAASVIAAPALALQEPCLGNSVPLTGPAAFGGLAVKYGAENCDRRDQRSWRCARQEAHAHPVR
jgi:hypothetical protein